ncbi:hypothetical protein BGZ76_004326, partial [Entomortierella beljakovae]
MDSDFHGYNMSWDHPGYALPLSNIAYHVYPDEQELNRLKNTSASVSQKAFQKIKDSYEEYEKLADVYQVELDQRAKEANERKAYEKLAREELLRQRREEDKIRRQKKSSKAPSMTPPRSSPQPFHPYHKHSQYQRYQGNNNNNSLTGTTTTVRGPPVKPVNRLQYSQSATTSILHGSLNFLSHHSQNQKSIPDSNSTHSAEQSNSNSNSPDLASSSSSSSPQLQTSNTPSPDSADSNSLTPSVSSSGTPISSHGSSFVPSIHTNEQDPAARQWLRKKRKQVIPVNPSVVNRIPGITLRIQPDTNTNQYLQVEVVKNLEDYQPMESPELTSVDSIDVDIEGDEDHSNDNHNNNNNNNNNLDSEALKSRRQSQAKLDLDKVRESIESSRPSYTPLCFSSITTTMPQSHASQLDLDSHQKGFPYYNNQSNNVSNANNNRGRSPHLKQPIHDSVAVTHGLGLDTKYWNNRVSTKSESVYSQDLDDIMASRADLPLSWDNFSTRDCQLNKVIGKHDRDFERLEEAVQEVISRQQLANSLSSDESDSHTSVSAHTKTRSRRTHTQEKENKSTSTLAAATATGTSISSSKPNTRRAGSRGHSRRPSDTVALSSSTTTATNATEIKRRTSASGRAVRGGGDTTLVQGYDDIEKILKAKRQKKREEKKRQESMARTNSEPVTDDEHFTDAEMAEEDEVDVFVMKEEDDSIHAQKEMLRRPKKSLEIVEEVVEESQKQKDHGNAKSYSLPNSPPSPPHSRQTSPVKSESFALPRRLSISSDQQQFHDAQSDNNGYSRRTHGSDNSSTPPATPLFAPISDDQLSSNPQHDRHDLTSSVTSGGRTRSRLRSDSNPIPPEGINVFFDSALEQISLKRKQQLAKKRAASTASTIGDEHHEEEGKATETIANEAVETITKESTALIEDSKEQPTEEKETIVAKLDSHASERGLVDPESASKAQSTAANLPKSSRSLPGRVLRKTRHASNQQDGHIGTGEHGREKESDLENEAIFDPDCTSCRLELDSSDISTWKEAVATGKIHLNPRTWS